MVYLVGCTIEIYQDGRPHKRQIRRNHVIFANENEIDSQFSFFAPLKCVVQM